ncbi:MAG: hypothetical protein J6T51_03280 [Kiritimatiellae bacterium]|nr:hypothetical protein [Kiritimatiellia bacterium]
MKRGTQGGTRFVASALGKIALVATALCAATAPAPSLAVTTHRMADTDISYSGGFITTGGVLVFPGKTLADLEGRSFWGTMAGGSFGAVKTGISNQVKPYPANATGAAIERYDFDIVTIEGTYYKAVHIQLYNGEGGVYAKIPKAWYIGTSGNTGFSTIYYTVNASTGALTWSKVNNSSIATTATAGGYGIRAIGVARGLSSTNQLVFPGLTVAQIGTDVRGRLSAKVAGGSGGSMLGLPVLFTNAVVTAGTAASPTAIRCEAQYYDGGNVKCAIVAFSDGGDGVYAQLVGAYYKTTTELGMRFVKDDGTKVDDSNVKSHNVPTWIMASGYGMYNVEATEESVAHAANTHFFNRYSYLNGTAQIVFPGVTLSELEGGKFYGLMQGAAIGGGSGFSINAYSHAVTRYPTDTADPVQKLFFALACVDGQHTKYVVVELSQGTGGVQAKAVKAMNKANVMNKDGSIKTHYATSIPFTVDASGAVAVASGFTNRGVAGGDHGDDYGIKQLGVMSIVGTNTLVFRGLRVKDIFSHEITGRACGSSISNSDQMQEMKCFNRIITATDSTTGEITEFRAEMQMPMGSAKCVSVRFTNGEDGVCATAIYAGYYATYDDRLGRKVTNDAGTGVAVNNYSIASASAWSGGYGVCDLSVARHDEDGTPATAVWNGGDPAATSSWTCKAADGTALPDTLPGKYTQVHISSDITMATDADLTPYASVMTTAANLTINTSGHKLYVKTLEPWKATTVTDSVGGGELHVVVPEGTLTYNSQIALSDKLKLVTEGEGLFMAAKTAQAYTGGTQVAAGTLMYAGNPSSWPLGKNGTKNVSAQIVTVDAGATLDLNGKTAFGYTTVVFNGGTVRGSTTQFNGAKQLTADSYLNATGDFYMQTASNPLVLNGYTLEVAIAGGKTLKFDNCAPQGPGKIKITSGGYLQTLNAAYDARDVDFIVGSALNITSTLSVHDYEAAYNYNANDGTAALNVYGTFKPGADHDYFYGCTMQNGSTIDLSARTTALPRVSSFTSGQNRLEFAAGATVNVEIGDRSSDVGTCLVSWPSGSAPDLSVGFALLANGEAVEGKTIAVKDDGLYIKDTSEPEYAMWVNDGWLFYKNGTQDTEWGGSVTSNMQVRFTTAAEYDAICAVASTISPSAYVLATNEFRNAEGATFDFTRTGALVVLEGTVFDAKGGCLKLPAALAGGVNAFTVTNSTAQVGSLEVEVPENDTTTSTKMALTGNLKFVKSGLGTFVVKKEYQTFTGGTQVAAGTLKYASEPAHWPLGGNGVANVSAQVVTVDEGATLDINGYGGFGYTTVVFNGGTVRGSTTQLNGAKRLTANSYLNATGEFYMQTASNPLVLNGYTLEVAIAGGKTLKFDNCAPQGPGKIKITSGGYLQTLTSACVATNVDFTVGCALKIETALSVHDYEAVYDYNANSGTAALNVYGVFKPSAHNYFYGCTMQDGSTLDLTSRTNAWPVTSAFTSGSNTVAFVENANVTVKLEGRADLGAVARSEAPYVATWEEQAAPPASVKFAIDPATRRRGYKIRRDDEHHALRLVSTGFVFVVR